MDTDINEIYIGAKAMYSGLSKQFTAYLINRRRTGNVSANKFCNVADIDSSHLP